MLAIWRDTSFYTSNYFKFIAAWTTQFWSSITSQFQLFNKKYCTVESVSNWKFWISWNPVGMDKICWYFYILRWKCEFAQSCPTLWDPMDCSLPGCTVRGIFQARVLEWVAISFSRGFSWLRDRTWVSNRTWVSCIVGRCYTLYATREALRWKIKTNHFRIYDAVNIYKL